MPGQPLAWDTGDDMAVNTNERCFVPQLACGLQAVSELASGEGRRTQWL